MRVVLKRTQNNEKRIFPFFGNPHNDLRVVLKRTPNNEKRIFPLFGNPHNDFRVVLKRTPNNEKRENHILEFHIMISLFRPNCINC